MFGNDERVEKKAGGEQAGDGTAGWGRGLGFGELGFKLDGKGGATGRLTQFPDGCLRGSGVVDSYMGTLSAPRETALVYVEEKCGESLFFDPAGRCARISVTSV
jgi:hypothetical protein